MKKIIFLIDSLPGGGAEKVLVDIVENLDKTKFDITVMTSLAGGVHVKNIEKHVRYRPFFKDLKKPTNLGQIHMYYYNKLLYLFHHDQDL